MSNCHPNVLMDGHVSCEVYKQNSTPNSSQDSTKRIWPAILRPSVQSDVHVKTSIGRMCFPKLPSATKKNLQSPVCDPQVKVKAWTPCGGPILGAGGEPKETIFTNPYLQIASCRPCRSCRKSQKVPTMLFCPVRIPSNVRVVCSDRRL